MTPRRRIVWLAVLLGACTRTTTSNTPTSPSETGAIDELAPYPPGSWRYEPSALNQVLIPVAHILVRHRDAATEGFASAGFWLPPGYSGRSAAEAQTLAARIWREVAREPARFAEFAQRYSDDAASAAFGGGLGVLPAAALPETYLDALTDLPLGTVSRVVQTEFGFDLLKRVARPSDQLVSAQMLMIKYRGARGSVRNGQVPHRSREEAWRLAIELARTAAGDPERFSDLVESHSETEFTRAGDIGVWSTCEPSPMAVAINVLSGLAIGEISPVIDTPNGFAVFRRTRATERPSYASNEIGISYDDAVIKPLGVEISRTRSEAQALVASVLARLRTDPTSFDAMREQYCDTLQCRRHADEWQEGHGVAVKERILESLQIGDVAPQAVETGAGFVILRREQPRAVAAAPKTWQFEMPSIAPPKPKSLDDIVAHATGDELAHFTLLFKQHAVTQLTLTAVEQAQLSDLIDNLSLGLRTEDMTDRQRILQQCRAELRALLGPARYDEFQRLRERWLADLQHLPQGG
jgi:PPIC-type PPIASE domain